MKTLTTLVKNNLRILLRSRATAVAVIVGPLLLLFLAGLAFDTTSIYRVRVGAFASSYNDLSSSVLDTLSQSQFNVIKYDTEEECVDSVRLGERHACIVFPEHFTLGSSSNTIQFYVDPSRTTLVSAILETVEARISQQSSDLSKNLTIALVNALSSVRTTTDQNRNTIAELTTQVNSAGQELSQVSVTLSSPNAEFNIDQVGLADVNSRASLVAANSVSFANTVADSVESIDEKLKSIGARVNSSGLDSATKSNITTALSDANALTADILDDANETRSLLSNTNLSTAIGNLTLQLNLIKGRVDELSAARTASVADINRIRVQADEALVKVSAMQKAFNEITSAIDSATVTDPEAVVSPIKTSVIAVTSQSNYLNFAFPFLIVLVLLFSGIVLPPVLILSERHSSAAFRTLLVPVKDYWFMASVLVSTLIVLSVQVLLMLIAVSFFFQIFSGLPGLLFILLVISVLFILLGMLIGYLVNKEFHAVFIGIILGTILLFLADFIVPLDVMPVWASAVAEFNPVVIGGNVVRTLMLFGDIGVAGVLNSLLLLLFYDVVLALLVIAAYRGLYRLDSEKLFSKMLSGRKKPNSKKTI